MIVGRSNIKSEVLLVLQEFFPIEFKAKGERFSGSFEFLLRVAKMDHRGAKTSATFSFTPLTAVAKLRSPSAR